jgi:hypothetical protein
MIMILRQHFRDERHRETRIAIERARRRHPAGKLRIVRQPDRG